MNLYGDNGNLRILERELKHRNDVDVRIDRYSINDDATLQGYDFVYMGSGTEQSLLTAVRDMHRIKRRLKDYIEEGNPLLMTGNSFLALGKSIENIDGKHIEALGLVGFSSKLYKTRDTKDVVFHLSKGDADDLAIGFMNRSFTVDLEEGVEPLFDVVLGIGNNKDALKGKFEGIKYKNTYCSSMTGPILVKNPWFLQKVCKMIMDRIGMGYIPSDDENQKKAYEMGLAGLLSSNPAKG
jgi:CobQ-like glutamine amidotransferase family enzyme